MNDDIASLSQFFKGRNKFNIIHQNIRSVRENFNAFLIVLDGLDILPDVIVLSEIWIHDWEIGAYAINGYLHYFTCNNEYRAGGVVVYISNRYPSRLAEPADKMRTADSVKVIVDIQHSVSLTIFALYRLHLHSKLSFIDEFEATLSSIHDRNFLVIGDINLCLFQNSIITDKYKTVMASFGLDQLINVATRSVGNSFSLIDHIYLRSNGGFTFVGQVFALGLSDHHCIYCSLVLNDKLDHKLSNNNYQTKKIDYNKLRNLIHDIDWSFVLSNNNASNAFEMFLKCIVEIVNQSAYFNKVNNKYKILKPWMTVDLCKRQVKRTCLYKKVKKHPNNARLGNYFQCFSNKLKFDMIRQKENYYFALFERNKTDMKKQWSTINSVLGSTSVKKEIDSMHSFRNPGDLLVDQNEIADEFNSFFVHIVEEIRNNLDSIEDLKQSELNYDEIFTKKTVQRSMFLTPTNSDEVSQTIKMLKSNKSPGIDGVSVSVVKYLHDLISPILAYIFNLSMESGVFPEKLKVAVVIPIFKKGDPKDFNNYRPISLLSVFSKVFEKLIKFRLLLFLNQHNYFNTNQFGFMDKKSTEDALLKFCSEIADGLNVNNKVSGIFVDITKAFDSVDHAILLSKVWDAGIRGVPWNWFASYLKGRSQQVRVQNCLSSEKVISCGVPQGSVHGPILFLIYINDLCSGNFDGNLTCFADDTALSYSLDTTLSISRHMQKDINKLKLWFTANKMALSNKTKYVHFSLRCKDYAFNSLFYKCSQCLVGNIASCSKCLKIQQVKNIKYLGLTIDENLSWKVHLENIKNYLFVCLRKFYLLRPICPLPVLKTVYFSIIDSKLQYGIICWGGVYLSNISSINVVQKRIVRVMMKVNRYEHSFPLFKVLKIFPLRHLFIFRVLRMFFKRSGHLINNMNVYSSRLRNRNFVATPRPYNEFYKRSFMFCAPTFFNMLPFEVSNSATLKIYLKRLKEWVFNIEGPEEFFL